MILTYRQLAASRKLALIGAGAVWWRVGLGKTRIAYNWFATIAKAKPSILFVVCRREAFMDWKQELTKANLKWDFSIIEEEGDFPSIIFPPQINTVFVLSHGKLARLQRAIELRDCIIDAIVFDEGFLYKNSQTKHAKAAHRLSEAIGKALILSGSMMTARNLEDIYGQLYAINRQQPIGRTLTEFRSRYRTELMLGTPRGARWANRAGAATRVGQAIGKCCSVYFPNNNQRRVITSVRLQSPTSVQTNAFEQLRKDYWLSLRGKELIIKNAPNLITKCQQISDGWVSMSDQTVVPLASAKLDYLIAQVAEFISCGEKVVVWCAFRHSVRLVLQALQNRFPRLGIYSLTGGTKFDRIGWNKDGRVCVGTEASGSSVNFLKDCAYAIYYSMDFRWLNLQQSKGRTNRYDSKHTICFYYYLQIEGSLDHHVYKMVHLSSRKEQELITITAIQSWLKTSQ